MRARGTEAVWRLRSLMRRAAFAIPAVRRWRFRARTRQVLGWMAEGDHRVRLSLDTWDVEFPCPDDRWPLLPQPIRFQYVPERGTYRCRIGDTSFSTSSMPLFEILNELRGYCLLGKPAPGETCIDLGAGAGITNVYFSARIQGCAMFALEPDPWAAHQLREDLRQNGLENARVIRAAVAPESGSAAFDLRSPGSSRVSTMEASTGRGIEVRAMTLPDVVAAAGGRADYLKADIEGMEAEIAEPLGVLIRENRIRVAAVASYHRIGDAVTASMMEGIFRRMGDVCSRTVYPRHPTTFVARSDDDEILGRLSLIPPARP